MKKALLFFLIIILFAGFSLAQSIELQLIGVMNGDASDSEVQLEWSVGESFSSTYQTNFGLLTEGFIQPEKSDFEFPLVVEPLILESKLDFGFEIFPNPTRNQITLKLNEPSQVLGYVSILDMTGSILYQEVFPLETQQQNFDVTDYPPGIYFIQYFSPERKIRTGGKFLKLSTE